MDNPTMVRKAPIGIKVAYKKVNHKVSTISAYRFPIV